MFSLIELLLITYRVESTGVVKMNSLDDAALPLKKDIGP